MKRLETTANDQRSDSISPLRQPENTYSNSPFMHDVLLVCNECELYKDSFVLQTDAPFFEQKNTTISSNKKPEDSRSVSIASQTQSVDEDLVEHQIDEELVDHQDVQLGKQQNKSSLFGQKNGRYSTICGFANTQMNDEVILECQDFQLYSRYEGDTSDFEQSNQQNNDSEKTGQNTSMFTVKS